VENPVGDGNCGFRCLSMAIHGDESKYQDIKDRMLGQLKEMKDSYFDSSWFINDSDYDKVEKILSHTGGCLANQELWFSDPECSQLAADTFETPIEFHGPQSSTLYLPIMRHTKYKSYRPIVLNLHSNHIYYVTMKKGTKYGYAGINIMHNAICEKLGIPNQSESYAG
jgi:hypothetical protein